MLVVQWSHGCKIGGQKETRAVRSAHPIRLYVRRGVRNDQVKATSKECRKGQWYNDDIRRQYNLVSCSRIWRTGTSGDHLEVEAEQCDNPVPGVSLLLKNIFSARDTSCREFSGGVWIKITHGSVRLPRHSSIKDRKQEFMKKAVSWKQKLHPHGNSFRVHDAVPHQYEHLGT